MARPLRVEYPGAFYHVVNRGNAGEKLFKNKRDREKFLHYVGQCAERFTLRLHTYCLMTNHYHLLVETFEANLSKAIQWLNVSYAVYFNRKRRRNGHLFQGRFKSILLDADEYLKHVSRYIHLNPVRANMVEAPAEYAWSSYRAFVGKAKTPEWLETGWLLRQFGAKKRTAIRNYSHFVEMVDVDALESPDKDLVGGFILGGPEFVSWVKEAFLSSRADNKEMPQLRQLKPAIKMETIVEAVAREFDCKTEAIFTRGRKKNTARDMAIYLAYHLTGESGKRLGECFGGISGAAITLRHNHILTTMERNRKLKACAETLKKRILNN